MEGPGEMAFLVLNKVVERVAVLRELLEDSLHK